MKIRQCDVCKKFILKGKIYYKVSSSEMIDKKQKLTHCADLCVECMNKIIKKV